jgi:nitroimidazol reductase NimA-like FMN-containing flavoprotein (pyridoxamine 5'-phosphate oxidase superfamily)
MKPKTSRIEPSRLAKRMRNDEETIHTILDESLVCHVSYLLGEQPFIIPTSYCRVDNTIYLHGSVGSHFFMQLAKGIPVCIAVTLIDALVLARSVFHHSLNYRSVVAFGTTRLVDDPAERWMAAERFTEHVIPGRWNDARQPSESEFKKTMFIAVEMEEVSAKVRDMGVGDDPEDMEAAVWAGLLPLKLNVGIPQQDEQQQPNIPVPSYISQYKR